MFHCSKPRNEKGLMATHDTLLRYNATFLLDRTAYGLEQRRGIRSMRKYLPAGARVLDIGAGFGSPTRDAARFFEMQACDIRPTSPEQQAFVEIVMRMQELPFQWIDTPSLPYAESSFDGVMLYAVLEHVADKVALLAECRRVLRPGGVVFVFRAVNRHAFAEKLAALLGYFTHGNDNVTARQLRDAIAQAGLTLSRMGYHGWLPENGLPSWPIYYMNLLLSNLPLVNHFSHDFWLVATKPMEQPVPNGR